MRQDTSGALSLSGGGLNLRLGCAETGGRACWPLFLIVKAFGAKAVQTLIALNSATGYSQFAFFYWAEANGTALSCRKTKFERSPARIYITRRPVPSFLGSSLSSQPLQRHLLLQTKEKSSLFYNTFT